MKILIDESRCIAAGNCVMVAPEIYDQREDDGIVVLLDDSPEGAALQAKAREGAAICPSKVVTILD
ncbi:ferredoxin [Microbacterium thalassium]|uniref:Ferredoxin n=1 Tax=Microbacterium thalassium TaxID=362649 RepID=A0A7X0FN66_9MICO|nr:ferredoxin [Microbacterium thalassium]MBB6390509.1 ferredoxin [Microbacterium thalassium]GLK25620.1 ferredoxin [Microbacterium thalassium]